MADDVRYQQLKRKVKNQRLHLRRLERHVRHLNIAWQLEHERASNWQRSFFEASRRPVDYRSVCQCWTCRLREWWRFASGETYPGKSGWRFPWAKRS